MIAIASFVFGYMASESNQAYQYRNTPAASLLPVRRSLEKEKLWDLVNQWRISQGFPSYTVNQKLCDFAKVRLIEIENDWSHDGFLPLVERYFNNENNNIAENLANDFDDESAVLSRWLSSPTHRKNLDDSYRYSCIETKGNRAVQIFGNLY